MFEKDPAHQSSAHLVIVLLVLLLLLLRPSVSGGALRTWALQRDVTLASALETGLHAAVRAVTGDVASLKRKD